MTQDNYDMNKIIISILLFYCAFSFDVNAQNETNFSIQFKNELKSFIDTIKPHTIKNGKYNVYVAKFNQINIDNECTTSITLGYIQNDYDLKYTYFNYYFTLDSELVLVYVQDSIALSKLADFNIDKISKSNVAEILDKVCNSKYVSISGRRKGQILCFKDNNFSKVYYPDSDKIRKELSIYDVNKIIGGSDIKEMIHPELSPGDSIDKK